MKKIGIALAVIAALVVVYKVSYPTYTYRYRMTVQVDDGGETRSASSVIEVRVSKQPQFLPEVGPLSSSVRGQAVFVDLTGGRNLVALLASGSTGEDRGFPKKVVPSHFKLNVFRDQDLTRLPDLRGRWELAPDELPTLVTVTNPNDAATARVVRPAQVGVRLRSITIEMTTDSVASPKNIETKLPFLVKQKQASLEYNRPDVFTPNYSSFVKADW